MQSIATRYQRFADAEAKGRSALYETLARHVAQSSHVLAFLARLPQDRQQPNLLFAAVRLAAGTPTTPAEFDAAIADQAEAITEIMRTRTTQTNEPGRCAVLLPALARIEGPLALIEVGASASLCLLPDAYGYDWGYQSLAPPARFAATAPVLACATTRNTPLPLCHPEITWRAGLDLNPLDVSKDEDVAWLEHLVWPEHHERLARLRKAITIARRQCPRVEAGDLRRDLPDLVAMAPRDATVVIFHTAVLSYVTEQNDRDAFAESMMRDPRVFWLSNESPRVFPRSAAAAGQVHDDMFLLTGNGEPMAWTGPHGQEIRWL